MRLSFVDVARVEQISENAIVIHLPHFCVFGHKASWSALNFQKAKTIYYPFVVFLCVFALKWLIAMLIYDAATLT